MTQLNRDIVKVVEAPAAKKQLAGYGVTAGGSTVPEFSAEIKNELRTWADMAKSAGIKPQ